MKGKRMDIQVSASLLSADFSKLGEDLQRVEKAGADRFHIDVMDGHFVPNLTLGAGTVRDIRSLTDKPFDVHLMVDNPSIHFEAFAEAGADVLFIHVETCPHLEGDLKRIRSLGMEPGVTLNPSTPASSLQCVTHAASHVLVMTVNPGFGGQSLIPEVLPKLKDARKLFGKEAILHVDGGVKGGNVQRVREAGADIVVAGSWIFGSESPAQAIQDLRTSS